MIRRVRSAITATLLTLLLAPAAGAQQPPSAPPGDSVQIRGIVLSAVSGMPLARATVSLVSDGRIAIADEQGRFRFSAVRVGTAVVRARLLGYRSEEQRVPVRDGTVADLTFRLRQAPLSLSPVRTQAQLTEREKFETAPEVGAFIIDGGVAQTLPSVGEADVLRTAQLLPGVIARSDFSAGLNVRGGEADQNLVLLDGITLFNPFHLGGVFGTFIGATVGDFKLLTGGFPAAYGGRLSSVLEVTSAEEARQGVHGQADLSMLAASLALGGALPSGKTSWNFAARRTYADKIAQYVADRAFPYHFQDVQFHGTQVIPGGGSLSITAYHGLDDLKENLYERHDTLGADGGYAFDWGNDAAGVTLALPVGRHSTLVQRASISRFKSTLDLGSGSFIFRNQVTEMLLNGTVTSQLGPHLLSVGYGVSRNDVRYREESPQTSAQLQRFEQKPIATSLFADDVWKIGSKLLLRPGVRLESVPSASWTGVSPRLSARYFIDRNTALTAAVGRYAQWIHSLRDEEAPLRLFDLWVASDSAIPVTTSEHAVLGVERWMSASRFVRVEGFVKNYPTLIEPNPANDRAIQGDEFRPITGRSSGFDVYLRQLETGPISGWVAYTYTQNHREQGGQSFYPAQDRRHNLNVVGSYRTSSRYVFGARFGYGSPTPYTPVQAQLVRRYYDGSGLWEREVIRRDVQPVGGERNAARLPSFHRLDFSVQRAFSHPKTTMTPYLNIVNVYNRHNVFAYDFDYQNAPPSRSSISQLPFLPTVGLTVEF